MHKYFGVALGLITCQQGSKIPTPKKKSIVKTVKEPRKPKPTPTTIEKTPTIKKVNDAPARSDNPVA